jgi:hypothetical protein
MLHANRVSKIQTKLLDLIHLCGSKEHLKIVLVCLEFVTDASLIYEGSLLRHPPNVVTNCIE